ncbi:sensor histidine kinase [Paenibacillus nicotianae]|uniref:histidine kinase n=1 Tax=Paenibacillus nicotianae TaxID=1526551 RepID=A0ABW4USA3_9BACL
MKGALSSNTPQDRKTPLFGSRGLSLRWKFPLLLAGLLLCTVGVLSTLVLIGIQSNQKNQIENTLKRQSELIGLTIRQEYLAGNQKDPQQFMKLRATELAGQLGISSNMRIILYDATGQLSGDSLPVAPQVNVKQALTYALKGQIAYITAGSSVIYLSPIQGSDGLLGVVQLHLSIAEQQAFYQDIVHLLLGIGLSVLIISFVVGWLYIRKQTTDIGRLTQETHFISQGQYPPPHTTLFTRKDELGQLGDGIVQMGQMIAQSMNDLENEKQQLEQAVTKLTALEQLQKAFIGNISHELKTPITSIQAYADLLNMYGDDPTLVHEASESIAKETKRLIELIEDSIRLSLLEKYDFELQVTSVPLDKLLQDVAKRTQGKASTSGIDLQVQTVAVTLTTDPKHLMHILLNLLDNAVKYNRSDHGWIHLSNELYDHKTIIRISNSGAIIPEDQWENVFEPYATLSSDRARTGSGTGLGLPLARRLAERLQGKLYIKQSDLSGTEFVLELPL